MGVQECPPAVDTKSCNFESWFFHYKQYVIRQGIHPCKCLNPPGRGIYMHITPPQTVLAC